MGLRACCLGPQLTGFSGRGCPGLSIFNAAQPQVTKEEMMVTDARADTSRKSWDTLGIHNGNIITVEASETFLFT